MQKAEVSPTAQSKQESPYTLIAGAHKNFKTVGQYTIDFSKFLGSGKYGKVYNAFHEKEYKNGKRYACKVIELGGSAANDKNDKPLSNEKIDEK